MLLTVDIGNTNTIFVVFVDKLDGTHIVFESRMNTDANRMSDQYAIFLMDTLRLYELAPANINGAIISSVVPPVTYQLKTAIEKLCNVTPLLVGPGLKTGLNIKIDEASTLGGDLVCAAVAAKNLYKAPSVVIDLGTVTKIMAIDKGGSLIGGIFYPGVSVGLKSLAESAATLPLVHAERVERVIYSTASEAISSGILNGTASMIDGMTARFEKEIGDAALIATGGYAAQIIPYCERKFILNPNLVSEGLRIIYGKNTALRET